jgi:hypothetical protein
MYLYSLQMKGDSQKKKSDNRGTLIVQGLYPTGVNGTQILFEEPAYWACGRHNVCRVCSHFHNAALINAAVRGPRSDEMLGMTNIREIKVEALLVTSGHLLGILRIEIVSLRVANSARIRMGNAPQ